MTTRGIVVDMLMGAANAGVQRAAGEMNASMDEVLSAYLTLAKNAVLVALDNGGDPAILRAGVERILIELPPRGPTM